MTPERWQRLETLFAAAQAIRRGEHASFLDQACRDEPEIRAELQSLLEYRAESDDFWNGLQFGICGSNRPPRAARRRVCRVFRIESAVISIARNPPTVKLDVRM
jgi:hypothetical protein